MPWRVTRKSRFQIVARRLSLTAVAAVVLASCGVPAPEGITISEAPTTSPTSSIPQPPPEPAPVEATAVVPPAVVPVEPAPVQPPPPVEPPPAEPPPPPADARSGCDESYPSVCIPPAPPDLDCGDIPHGRFQVLPPDPHGFDGKDNDGVGCESN